MVVTEQTLLQLAETKPASTNSLKQVQGFTEAKLEKYGAQFLAVLDRFAAGETGIRRDDFPVVKNCEKIAQAGLSETIQTTYSMFIESKNIQQVIGARGLKASTIISHLASALEAGLEVDIESLGVTPTLMVDVTKAIYFPPISSDVSR